MMLVTVALGTGFPGGDAAIRCHSTRRPSDQVRMAFDFQLSSVVAGHHAGEAAQLGEQIAFAGHAGAHNGMWPY